MVDFIVRARAAPVDPDAFRAAIGKSQGVEYLADIIKAGLLVSKGHRPDVALHLVLERSSDFSRVLTFKGSELPSFKGLQEDNLLDAMADALKAAVKLGKDQAVVDKRGLTVSTISFEHFVKRLAETRKTFVLRPDGADIRTTNLPENAVFVLTDHTPMPRKTFSSMARQGVSAVSVGPLMLHASQCISILLNEMDRR